MLLFLEKGNGEIMVIGKREEEVILALSKGLKVFWSLRIREWEEGFCWFW